MNRKFWIRPDEDYRTDHILLVKEYEEMKADGWDMSGWIEVEETGPEPVENETKKKEKI